MFEILTDPFTIVDDVIGDSNDASQYGALIAVARPIIERTDRTRQHEISKLKSLLHLKGAVRAATNVVAGGQGIFDAEQRRAMPIDHLAL